IGSFLSCGSLGGTLFGAFLGLLARLSLLGIVARRSFLDARGIEEAGHAVAWLCTGAEPVTHAVLVQLCARRIGLGQQRVVGSELVEIAASTRPAAAGSHDPARRTPLSAAAR